MFTPFSILREPKNFSVFVPTMFVFSSVSNFSDFFRHPAQTTYMRSTLTERIFESDWYILRGHFGFSFHNKWERTRKFYLQNLSNRRYLKCRQNINTSPYETCKCRIRSGDFRAIYWHLQSYRVLWGFLFGITWIKTLWPSKNAWQFYTRHIIS